MSFLSEILARKRDEVASRRAVAPDHELEGRISHLPPPRSLYEALSPPGGPTRIIAEVKRASPSAGSIDRTVDAPALAARYARAGAAAVSVLTDGPGFGGSLGDLAAIRQAVDLPLLRKDFILDRYQLLEARLHGADAVLLIVAALSDDALGRLFEESRTLGLEAVVEVHEATELARACRLDARLIGVNNRDLRSFRVDLATSETLLPQVPATARAIAESGIASAADVRRLRAAGAANLLVGEALVRAPDPAALLRCLAGA